MRDEAEENVNTLVRDLDDNVQPLITAADAAPAQLSKAIPLLKHLDALYDVLLRVEEASRVWRRRNKSMRCRKPCCA